jgi:hypothetical protein
VSQGTGRRESRAREIVTMFCGPEGREGTRESAPECEPVDDAALRRGVAVAS